MDPPPEKEKVSTNRHVGQDHEAKERPDMNAAAVPLKFAHVDAMVDDYNLHQMLQPAKPEQIQDLGLKLCPNFKCAHPQSKGCTGR